MRPASTALHDPAVAAIRDACRAMLGLAALTDRPVAFFTETPGAVGDRLDEWLATNGEGTARCRHLGNNNRGPRVVLGMLHRPGDLWGVDCAPAALAVQAEAHPWTCDACGKTARRFHELVVQIASLLVQGNVCTSCMRQAGRAW